VHRTGSDANLILLKNPCVGDIAKESAIDVEALRQGGLR
jgi:hypothetical protein